MNKNTDRNTFKDELAEEAKRLRIYMTHDPQSDEFMGVLSYRTGQAIAATERRLVELNKFAGRFSK